MTAGTAETADRAGRIVATIDLANFECVFRQRDEQKRWFGKAFSMARRQLSQKSITPADSPMPFIAEFDQMAGVD